MHATTLSTFAGTPARRTGLISMAVLAAVAMAAGAALLQPGQDTDAPASAAAPAAAMVPVGIVGDSAVSGDPSVPSAASVFRDRNATSEEPSVTF